MMQKLRRNIVWALAAGVLGTAGCSEPAAEAPAPAPDFATVIIGCGEAGADIETRTELAADGLAVNWVAGDAIRLWARETGAATFLPDAEDVPFTFSYYSPSKQRAGFAGELNVAAFSESKTYDYYAVSPTPDRVEGMLATYTIPAVQTGEYDGACDVLTAKLTDAPALRAGDDNPYVKLPFEHHLHLLRFTIPSSLLTEDIVAVELIFPEEKIVAGELTVDALGQMPDRIEGENTLRVEFREPKRAGDSFYAMIAPTDFEEGMTIGMRVMATTTEASVDYTFAQARSFAAGHTTPIALHVPEADTYFTVLQFAVAEAVLNGAPAPENRYGEDTLGERVQRVRLKSEEGAFSNAVSMMPTGLCEVLDDGATLECTIPDAETAAATGFDGTYTLTYVSRKDEGSRCPYTRWRGKSVVSGAAVQVEYESPQTLVRTTAYHSGTSVTFEANVPAIVDGQTNIIPDMPAIPYLLYEDFNSAVTYHNEDNNTVSVTRAPSNTGSTLSQTQIALGNEWNGVNFGTESGAIRLCHRGENAVNVAGNYPGRLDTPNLCFIKESAQVAVSFSYSMNREGNNSYFNTHYFSFGTHSESGTQNTSSGVGNNASRGLGNEGFGDTIVWTDSNRTVSDFDGDYNTVDNAISFVVSSCTSATRFVWGIYLQESLSGTLLPWDSHYTNYHNYWLYLDNIKALVVPLE